MIQKLKSAFFILIFSVLSLFVFSQDKYYYLIFKKADITAGYNQPGFDRFIFSYYITSGSYSLKGAAYDAYNNKLGSTFYLTINKKHHARQLKCKVRGLIYLTKEVMDDKGVDGSKSLYLKPKKYHEGEAGEDDYVSYRATIADAAFTDFDFNPSPPATAPEPLTGKKK